jgi:pyrroline-5-carboxylate reductase
MAVERIGFIGAGHIAESMIRGIITSGYLDPGQIVISDIDEQRMIQMHQTLGPTITSSNKDNAARAQIVFLAVKPAQIQGVAAEIREVVTNEHFVVSVAAGTSIAAIRSALGEDPLLCRVMPNLSTSVRRSTIGLFAEAGLGTEKLGPVYALLSHLGKVFRIDDESSMAVITALSGSAPAYYVMMADALVRYGVSQGMPRELATEMILGTMEGSAAWASSAKVTLDELWRKVVTPGGTTEAGINYYQDKGFIEIFIEGLARSVRRARELGDQ